MRWHPTWYADTRTAFAALKTAHAGETSGAEVSSSVRLVHGIEYENDGADILQPGLIPNISDNELLLGSQVLFLPEGCGDGSHDKTASAFSPK